jgi:flagella basal body P-ring formation protein FlgA
MRLKSIFLIFWTTAAVAGCIVVSGSEVVANDLAQRFPGLSGAPRGQVVMLAPSAGVTRFVTPLESSRIWGKLGLRDTPTVGFCIERKSSLLTAAQLLPALRRSFPDEKVQISLLDFSRFPVPDGELEFSVNGLQASARTSAQTGVLWKGRVVSQENHSTAIWVRVRLSVEREIIVAKHDLAANQKVTPADLETRRGLFNPLDSVSDVSQSVLGLVAKRPIRAGQRLASSLFSTPADITAGQVVKVDVLLGQVHLRLEAVAEASGNRGDSVWLKQANSGKRFKGRITGPQQAELQIGQDDPQTISVSRARVGGDTR